MVDAVEDTMFPVVITFADVVICAIVVLIAIVLAAAVVRTAVVVGPIEGCTVVGVARTEISIMGYNPLDWRKISILKY